jgi:hypothetical protein
MPKSEAANPRRTDNAMTNKKEKKRTKRQNISEKQKPVYFSSIFYILRTLNLYNLRF